MGASSCTVRYDLANARLKQDVQLVLLLLSSGFVMRVCAPSALCEGTNMHVDEVEGTH